MPISFTVSDVIPATPEEIYISWLDSTGHTAMIGSPSKVSDKVGETFDAWDGYISGKNLELQPSRRILQAWRTSEFAPETEDSRLEILLEAVPGGTEITIHHSNLPPDGMQYQQGWRDAYFEPMKEYFSSRKG